RDSGRATLCTHRRLSERAGFSILCALGPVRWVPAEPKGSPPGNCLPPVTCGFPTALVNLAATCRSHTVCCIHTIASLLNVLLFLVLSLQLTAVAGAHESSPPLAKAPISECFSPDASQREHSARDRV